MRSRIPARIFVLRKPRRRSDLNTDIDHDDDDENYDDNADDAGLINLMMISMMMMMTQVRV